MKFTTVFLTCIALVDCLIRHVPLITFPGGRILGEEDKTQNGRYFYKFWCIPYGDHERFEPSVLAKPWKGVLDGTSCGVRCPQTDIGNMQGIFFEFPEKEDCLILNVFMPAHRQKKGSLPVMVWFHGGYFVCGSSLEYSGEILLNEDVILVTVNYRLGPLGFLTSGDGILESNLGLKDMVLSLEWVKENIQYFGGDPNLVTIFGESAGGAAVGLLLLSPLTTGLFNYAIAHSGSSLTPCAFQSKPGENFQAFTKQLNCSAPTIQESVACLKKLDFADMTELAANIKWSVDLEYPLFPAVEFASPSKSKKFLPDHPRVLLKQGKFQHVPLIIGVVEDESALHASVVLGDSDLIDDLRNRWIPMGGVAIGLDNRNISEEKLNQGLMKMRQFYFGVEEIGPHNFQQLVDMLSDSWFVHSLDFTVRHHANYAPVYPYIFTKKGGLALANFAVKDILNRTAVAHGEELQYLFFKGVANTKREKLFGQRFSKLWASFATTGKPSETWGSGTSWPPAERNTFDYKVYVLDDDTNLITNPWKKRNQLWDQLSENEWKDYEIK